MGASASKNETIYQYISNCRNWLTNLTQVCFRLHWANKRVLDPDLDNLINPHEVKHWMDPEIIPFGWGLFKEEEEEVVVEKKCLDGQTNKEVLMKPGDLEEEKIKPPG